MKPKRRTREEASVDSSVNGRPAPYDILSSARKRADAIKGALISSLIVIATGIGVITYKNYLGEIENSYSAPNQRGLVVPLEEPVKIPDCELSPRDYDNIIDKLYEKGLLPQNNYPASPPINEDRKFQYYEPKAKGLASTDETEVSEKPKNLTELVNTSAKKISERGIEFIKNHENLNLEVYACPTGHPTIGYGHKLLPGENYKTITREKAEEILMNDIEKHSKIVERSVKVPLTQDQYDSLVSFAFNLPKAFSNEKNSKFLRELNAGNYDQAAREMKRWNKGSVKRKVGKKIVITKEVISGLKTRRNEESQMFFGNLRN